MLLLAIAAATLFFLLHQARDEHGAPAEANTCIACHAAKRSGFGEYHAFGADNCVICHAGDDRAMAKDTAHAGMTGFPGNLDNAETSCGTCHADKVAGVTNNLMHTARGMVAVTRKLVDGDDGAARVASLQSLGHGPADSMLRKLCAACHLGQAKTAHALDAMHDRGGGCLACHINAYAGDAHPALSKQVSDARCFGCHSRSGRISLSYTGLAEADPASEPAKSPGLRLPDGRHIERRPADVHYLAGMSCIDCHTSEDVMGDAGDALHQRDAVQARCVNCHAVDSGDNSPHDTEHERLACAACHSQWAPQCFGCHMEYDPADTQWDHVDQRMTAGRWRETRWRVKNGPGALGVNAENRIEIFIPGMVMTLAHPDWDNEKFVRVFAPLSPHTIGPARGCVSCHRSSVALGLGEGVIEERDGKFQFVPENPLLQDGLPADAWSSLDGSRGGGVPVDGQRPLNPQEMEAILRAPLKD